MVDMEAKGLYLQHEVNTLAVLSFVGGGGLFRLRIGDC